MAVHEGISDWLFMGVDGHHEAAAPAWDNEGRDAMTPVSSTGRTHFTIDVEMQRRWIPHFLAMLQYMEHLGKIGASRRVEFMADGDGDFRPRFAWDTDIRPASPSRYPIRDKNENGDRFFDAG